MTTEEQVAMKLDIFEPYDIELTRESRRYLHSAYDDSYDSNDELYSCSKYRGYNDYDDSTIDSAFEGLPDATWNVD